MNSAYRWKGAPAGSDDFGRRGVGFKSPMGGDGGVRRRFVAVVVVLGLMVAACGGDDSERGAVDIPEGATFCSVFNGEYRQTLQTSPVADPTAAERLVGWAEVLAALAPAEIVRQANDNARYARDIAEGVSPEDSVVAGSTAFHEWAGENC